jgi:hypothetical protein
MRKKSISFCKRQGYYFGENPLEILVKNKFVFIQLGKVNSFPLCARVQWLKYHKGQFFPRLKPPFFKYEGDRTDQERIKWHIIEGVSRPPTPHPLQYVHCAKCESEVFPCQTHSIGKICQLLSNCGLKGAEHRVDTPSSQILGKGSFLLISLGTCHWVLSLALPISIHKV